MQSDVKNEKHERKELKLQIKWKNRDNDFSFHISTEQMNKKEKRIKIP